MNTLTYTSDNQSAVTIELGKRRDIQREDACLDLHLQRTLAEDCPLTLTILIRTDGTVAEWCADFYGHANHYWTFVSQPTHPATDAQRKTLASIHYGTVRPFGVGGGLSNPVCVYGLTGLTTTQAETLAGVEPGSVAYNG